MIDLTVCIPVYNAEGAIERAIRSVAKQRVDADVEILVCDDGSQDSTRQILNRLAEEFSNLRVIANPSNRGRPYTRNRLLREARGRFLTWLDSDDEKYPEMLATQLEHLRSVERDHGADGLRGLLVYTNYHWWWGHSDVPKVVSPEQPDDPMEGLLSARFGGYLWLMMGLTETFRWAGPFDERLPRLQDLAFFIRFAELGGRFERVATEEPQCVYHKQDAGREAAQVWKSWCRIWRRNRHHYKSYGMYNARRWRRHHYRVSRRYAKANGDVMTYRRIVVWELLYIIRGRFRRVLFEV